MFGCSRLDQDQGGILKGCLEMNGYLPQMENPRFTELSLLVGSHNTLANHVQAIVTCFNRIVYGIAVKTCARMDFEKGIIPA